MNGRRGDRDSIKNLSCSERIALNYFHVNWPNTSLLYESVYINKFQCHVSHCVVTLFNALGTEDTNSVSFSEEYVSIPAESKISAARQSVVVVVWFSSEHFQQETDVGGRAE